MGKGLHVSGNIGEQRDKAQPQFKRGKTYASNKLNKAPKPRIAGGDEIHFGSLPGSTTSIYPTHDLKDYSGVKAGK